MSNIRHSSESNSHYTPPQIVEAARATLGGIDLDPCSCELAQEVVKASHYLTAGALFLSWHNAWKQNPEPARVLLNPPGGLLDPKTMLPPPSRKGYRPGELVSSQAVYWAKLWGEWNSGNVSSAVFVCFNLEVLRITQGMPGIPPAASFPICFLKDRPMYWNESTPVEKRGLVGQPTHAGAVVYLPPTLGRIDGLERFSTAFGPLGFVRL